MFMSIEGISLILVILAITVLATLGGLVLRGTPHSREVEQPSETITIDAIEFRPATPSFELRETGEMSDQLTRREREVARLAARRMTDKEIAKELAISEKTVGNHLYNIYSKLDIHSRHELRHVLGEIPDGL